MVDCRLLQECVYIAISIFLLQRIGEDARIELFNKILLVQDGGNFLKII